MYTSQVQLQVFPSKTKFFSLSPMFALFLLHTLCCFHWLLMLQPWKTAGVIFTGGQGTWVIKRASIFHRQKKKKTHSLLLLPSLSKHKTSAGSLSHWRVCVRVCVRSPPLENAQLQALLWRHIGIVFDELWGESWRGVKQQAARLLLRVIWDGEPTAFLLQQWAASPSAFPHPDGCYLKKKTNGSSLFHWSFSEYSVDFCNPAHIWPEEQHYCYPTTAENCWNKKGKRWPNEDFWPLAYRRFSACANDSHSW